MRRLTLGVLILGGGTLLALPFRRPSVPDPIGVDSNRQRSQSDLMDDASLEMLVREVTQDVNVPVLYDPHTDYTPKRSVSEARHLPLTYEDLAVPVDRDPVYEAKFNASAEVASRSENQEQTRRIAELEKTFAKKQFVDQSLAGLANGMAPPPAIARGPQRPPSTSQPMISPGDAAPLTGARLASSDRGANRSATQERDGNTRSPSAEIGRSGMQHSVLSQLPPPEPSSDSSAAQRPRQWIRQPD